MATAGRVLTVLTVIFTVGYGAISAMVSVVAVLSINAYIRAYIRSGAFSGKYSDGAGRKHEGSCKGSENYFLVFHFEIPPVK